MDHTALVQIGSPGSRSGTDATLTPLLRALRRGDKRAFDRLFLLVYDQLRAVARGQRRAWHGDVSLGTTALVHETYLKLVRQKELRADNRAHFLAVAAKAMRQILSNRARDQRRVKRGGVAPHVTFDDDAVLDLSSEQTELIETLEEALQKLEQVDKRQAEIVECRFFAGMSIEDTASALDASPATIKRHWLLAKAWLHREMKRQLPDLGP